MAMFMSSAAGPKSQRSEDGPAYVLAPLDPKKTPANLKRRAPDIKAQSRRLSETVRGQRFLEPSHAKASPRRQTCVDVLMGGHVEAFVELFMVTSNSLDSNDLSHSEAELSVLKSNLITAETAARVSDYDTVYMSYKRIADHFDEVNQLKTSRQFRNTAQAAAVRTGNHSNIAAAHHARGLVEEKLGDIEMAVACYQDMAKECTNAGADQTTACSCIIRSKTCLAEAAESSGDMDASLKHLRDAYGFTRNVDLPELASQCLFRIGRACELLGDADAAIESLEKYMTGSHPATPMGRNQACAVLARCYERRGDLETAIEYLKKLVETSVQQDQIDITIDSAAKLGELYSSRGDYGESIRWYTKAYEVAVRLKQPMRSLALRIALGKARAMALRPGYIDRLEQNSGKVGESIRSLEVPRFL